MLDLEEAVHIRGTNHADEALWSTPVVACSAGKGENLDEVARLIEKHRDWLRDGRLEATRREKRLAHVRRAIDERLEDHLWGPGGYGEKARALLDSGRAPYDVVELLLRSILSGTGGPGEPNESEGRGKRGTKHP